MSLTQVVTICQTSSQAIHDRQSKALRLTRSSSQTCTSDKPTARKKVVWTSISPHVYGLTFDYQYVRERHEPYIAKDVKSNYNFDLFDFDQICTTADIFEWELGHKQSHAGCHLRRKKKWSRSKTRLAMKDVHLRDLNVGTANRGQTLYIKARIYNKLKERLNTVQEKSRSAHLPAASFSTVVKKSTAPPPIPSPTIHKTQNSVQGTKMAPHQLVTENVPSGMDDAMANLFITLQHRDITPEDYDLLLRLDESIAPKTVSDSVVSSFRTLTVKADNAGNLCPICLQEEEIGNILKLLPCDHSFHEDCIDRWLTFNSRNCPLDGLPVDS